MRKLLIAFSGLDCAGKSTQIDLLRKHITALGLKQVYLWIRGGYTPGFNAAKNLLRRASGNKIVPKPGPSQKRAQAFQKKGVRRWWLRFALLDLMWLLGVQARWWRWRGHVVICDRYLLDTLIDFRLNFPQEKVEDWWSWRLLCKIAPQPDVGFMLLIPVEESLKRSRQKNEPFPDPPDVLATRLQQYKKISEQGNWRMLDGQLPVETLSSRIQAEIQSLLSPSASN